MAALLVPLHANTGVTAYNPGSHGADLPPWTGPLPGQSRPYKRIAPGLEQRLKRLEEQRLRRQRIERTSIGRIPEEQLRELERLQAQRQGFEVLRRPGAALPVRVMPASGGVRLDGGPVLSEAETSMLESDVSSIISISERMAASDTEEDAEEAGLRDMNKYRMPDLGKTRLHLLTKEPLSPTRRQVPRTPRRQSKDSGPTTPTSGRSTRPQSMVEKQDSPRPSRNESNENISDGDFVASGLSRAGSIYSLSRASFTGQLSHLTSMRLPDADSLIKRISSIPTAPEAAKTLSDAAEQIRLWVSKAADVLNGLNAEDDVEWAAAGGSDGIDDVDAAINRFDRLVQVYILSIERLQTRDDTTNLSSGDLTSSVKQMEAIIASWQKLKHTLNGVKEQVEIALEWEELWNSVLGEIAQEMDGLDRLVFEMEERRHEGAESLLSDKDSIDISELETIIEERPRKGPATTNNRFSLPPFSPSSPIQPTPQENKEDSSLLALFARMQPLRASLDFLPMRLSVFHLRGNTLFPSACLDLEQRRDQLEAQWKKLESDAESLRRELGEDRWVLVFRNAGKQALKMCESIARSYLKLRDAIDTGEQSSDYASFSKRVENYEAKKLHYGPAIERVLAIIDRGVMDRLTVNGEILRLQSDMKRRWTGLQGDMRDMDLVLEDVNSECKSKQLRDSVSTVVSTERSVSGSLADTPGTSPASSVVGNSRKSSFQTLRTPTQLANGKSRQSSYIRPSTERSSSRLSTSSIPRRALFGGNIDMDLRETASPSPSLTATRIQLGPEAPVSNKPRWTAGKTTGDRGFLPLSALEPSKYAKGSVTPKTNFLRAGSRLSTTPASAPARTTNARTVSTPSSLPRPASVMQSSGRKSSLPVPTLAHSSPLAQKSSMPAMRPASRLNSSARRTSTLPPLSDEDDADSESPSHHKTRPPSALGSSRRSSLLPPRTRSRVSDVVTLPARPAWK
ncbi:hypothetical protein LTR78_007899 [Recurvomyces mirabilis]|uniref:KAR9-domain-containing protein n=1 Tax=Recurvomyces mirabilis TaxID=574656 RepID=A0AAE0TUB6_9PEZI|nr:hypothetical protein LTR78_007899 [Recurvomyces mirabilis]KAK5152434.1 hypothetical protein LTS14_008381 [Recurvomyces mirabilis]